LALASNSSTAMLPSLELVRYHISPFLDIDSIINLTHVNRSVYALDGLPLHNIEKKVWDRNYMLYTEDDDAHKKQMYWSTHSLRQLSRRLKLADVAKLMTLVTSFRLDCSERITRVPANVTTLVLGDRHELITPCASWPLRDKLTSLIYCQGDARHTVGSIHDFSALSNVEFMAVNGLDVGATQWPPRLHTLIIGTNIAGKVTNLPPTLRILKTIHIFPFHISYTVDHEFPEGLQTLHLGAFSVFPMTSHMFPHSLTELYLLRNHRVGRLRPHMLPPQLQRLCIGDALSDEQNVYPATLTHLEVRLKYGHTHLTAGQFPVGLTSLTLCSNFNQPLTIGLLPSTLKILCIGQGRQAHFKSIIEDGALPHGLESLYMRTPLFNHQLTLPATLKHLMLPANYQHCVAMPPNSIETIEQFTTPADMTRDLTSPMVFMWQPSMTDSAQMYNEYGSNWDTQ
jgi:hypothetical protein